MSFDLENKTIKNKYYRKVIQTTPQMQLVLMHLLETEDIPSETHRGKTQFIRVEKGKISVTLENSKITLSDGESIIIPPNTKHYVKCIEDCHLYTIYSPPEHPVDRKQLRQPKLK